MKVEPRRAGANLSVDVDGRNVIVPWPATSAPRVDTIGTDGSLYVGTATNGATLNNRLGCASLPDGVEAVSYVLVGMGAASIREGHIAPNLHTPWLNEAVARIERDLRV